MRQLRRLFLIGAVVGILAVSLGQSTAMAASSSFFVGKCHAGGFSDLYMAVAAADNPAIAAVNKSITVCPGTYTITTAKGALNVTAGNLKIIGKKGAIVTTEAGYSGRVFNVSGAATLHNVTLQGLTFKPGDGYDQELIAFTSVKNALVQNLVIDGQGKLSADTPTALLFETTSGKLSANTIRAWHSPDYSGTSLPLNIVGDGAQTVVVTGNTITNFEDTGIQTDALASLTVTNNKITGPALVAAGPVASEGIEVNTVAAGKVSGNKITGGAFPGNTNTQGILVLNTSHFTLSANTIAHWNSGISLSSGCNGTTHNKVTGNTIQEVEDGVALRALGGCSSVPNNLDGNVVTGNKIRDTLDVGEDGIFFSVVSSGGLDPTAFGETVTGNTITHFATPLTSPLPDPAHNITGTFAPNTVH